MHEHALASLHPGRPVEELARGRPAQDQRGGRRRVEARWHAGQAVSPKRAVGGVRPDHRQIGNAVANLKAAHDDDIMSQHERRPAGCSFTTDPRSVPRCCPCIGAPTKGDRQPAVLLPFVTEDRCGCFWWPTWRRSEGEFATISLTSGPVSGRISDPDSAVFPGPHQVPEGMFRVGKTKVQLAAKKQAAQKMPPRPNSYSAIRSSRF
jgi:hypothetical protein